MNDTQTSAKKTTCKSASARPASMRSSADVLIDLPTGLPWCVAKRVTNRSGIEKHLLPGHT